MKKNYALFVIIFFCFCALGYSQYSGAGTFNKITSLAELTDGYYVITNQNDNILMTNGRSGTANTGYFISTGSGASAGVITNPTTANVWRIETNGSGRTIYNEDILKYAGYNATNNSASIEDNVLDRTRWTFTYASSRWTVNNVATPTRQLSYNASAPRFAAYGNTGQQELQLYKLATSSNTTVAFDSASLSIAENGTSIDVCVSIFNEDAAATSVDISLNGSSTATNGTDYDDGLGSPITFPQTITFPGGSSADICITFHMNDDAVLEGDETIILNLSNPTGGNAAALGGTTQHTLTIVDDETPPLANVVITEIMYNTSGTDDEWIEICNISGSPQDVSNYTIDVSGTTEYTFPPGTTPIPDGDCILVSLGDNNVAPYNPECPFTTIYNNGTTTNNLANSSRTISIIADDAGMTAVDSVTYNSSDGANGNDSTLHVIDATANNSNTNSNWQEVPYGGSPGLNTTTPSCIPMIPDINVEGNVGSFPDIAPDASNVPVGFNNTLFASTAIGTGTPPTKSFRIQNTGSTVLNINSITLAGTNPGDFALSSVPTSVAALSVETFDITFSPTATGARTAVVVIDSDDPDASEDPYEFNIKGNGVCSSATINVSSFAPIDGPVGSLVTITGNGFSGASVVTINGVNANVVSATATELVVEIPNITISGPFVITEGSCFTETTNFGLITDNTNCGLSDLIMSEIYDQDGGSLGYIEVFNGTGNTIDLSNYYIRRYGDAQDLLDDIYTDYYFPASQGTIDDGQIIFGRVSTDANPPGVTPDFDYINVGGFAGINGEDIFHLYNGTTLLDVFTVPNSTVGYTARRNVNTTGPNPVDSSEWVHTNVEFTSNLGFFGYNQVIDVPTVSDPTDFVGCGDIAQFEVMATPNDGANSLTYEWYYNEGNTSDLDWEPVTAGAFPLVTVGGNTSDTLTLTGPFENYNGYQFYCLVIEDSACGIASTSALLDVETTTWTSSNMWDNGNPDLTKIAIIDHNYDTSTSSFSACKLTINAGATLNIRDGDYVEINYDLIVDGSLDIETEGSLVMIDDTGTVTNNGSTVVRKTTTEMEPNDYTYWSSPVDYSVPGTTIQTVLTGFRPSRMFSFNTSQFFDVQDADGNAGADGFDDNLDAWTNHFSFMESGVGYAAMTNGTGSHFRTVTFNGLLNTGVIQVPVALSLNNADNNDDWNLLGNPYPSAISADVFIANNNSRLNGTIYLWTHEDDILISNPGPYLYNFNSNDYAMYNTVGGIGTASTGTVVSNIPTGNIASGQGFFVEATSAGTVEFNNSMRDILNPNNDFFRNAQSDSNTLTEKDRMWLNLSNPDGAFSQILIGYMPDGTLVKDRLYDGIRLNGSNYINFYSKDDTNTHKYGIQGRPSFFIEDVIPIGYDSNILGNLTISLYQAEGVLSDITVYLKDNLLNTLHDLSASDYTFTTENGSFENRFEILYQSDVLSIEDTLISANELSIIELSNGDVKFSIGKNLSMTSIEIMDLLGRTLYILEADSSEAIYQLQNLSQSAYIAKVTLSNGQTLTKRALKRR